MNPQAQYPRVNLVVDSVSKGEKNQVDHLRIFRLAACQIVIALCVNHQLPDHVQHGSQGTCWLQTLFHVFPDKEYAMLLGLHRVLLAQLCPADARHPATSGKSNPSLHAVAIQPLVADLIV